MNSVFKDLPYVVVYIDDITIISNTWEEHKLHLKEVMQRINKYGIKLRLDKCAWCMEEVQFLGFITNKYGLRVPKKYQQKLLNIPVPTGKKPLQRFLGMVQFIHKFIPGLYKMVQPLYEKVKKDIKWSWNKEVDGVLFEKLK